jgi:hypothetical protein
MSSVSMVTDDRERGIKDFIRAEHPSPSIYDAARKHFTVALEKKLTIEQLFTQASLIKNETVKKCTLDILEKSRKFLLAQAAGRTVKLPHMEIKLPNDKKLDVSPVWIRDCRPHRLMILHFWKKPLSEIQTRAAAGILSFAIEEEYRKYLGFELDFISISYHGARRRFEVSGWDKIQPLRDIDLQYFLQRLCDLWDAYQLVDKT